MINLFHQILIMTFVCARFAHLQAAVTNLKKINGLSEFSTFAIRVTFWSRNIIHTALATLIKTLISNAVVKYEDMVANFPFWLAQVINAFAFRFPKLATTRFTIRYRGEFRADNSPTAHKRAVLPGDHLRRLQPASIKKLNEMLEPELLALNYPLSLRSQAKRAA